MGIFAARALGEIKDTRAVEPLIEALKDSDKRVGIFAARALGNIGDARGVEPLIDALQDSDEEMRKWAADALEKLGIDNPKEYGEKFRRVRYPWCPKCNHIMKESGRYLQCTHCGYHA